jgi:transposase
MASGDRVHNTALTLSKPTRVRRSRSERRAIVEETLMSNASVAQVARRHGVNANQVFQWRRLHAQGLLEDEDPPKLIPVQLRERSMSSGVIELTFAEVQLRIEGSPDPATLRAVLDKVLG